MDGIWALEVMTPFGKQPATLTLKRSDGALSGHIKSQLGDVPLSDINEQGDRFDAVVSLTLQGRTYEAKVDGRTAGEQMTGTINIKFPLAPKINFSGTRAA